MNDVSDVEKMIEQDRQDGERAADESQGRMPKTAAEHAAARYVVAREKQDKAPRYWAEHVETAECMLAWQSAIVPVIPPTLEFAVAKLDLKPGNILVVKVLREGLTDKQLNQMQYGLQKFIGRKVLIVPPGSELSVIEGTKVPK
jgi:hypothetical protein